MISFLTPLVAVIWIGFVVCLGLILSARFTRAAVQKRISETLTPEITEEDLDLITRQKQEEMNRSFVVRSLAPLLKRAGTAFRSSAKGAGGAQIRDMLEQAGHPLGMRYPEFLALKMFCLLIFTGLALVTSYFFVPLLLNIYGLGGDTTMVVMMQMLWILIGAYVGFSGPTFWLRRAVNTRLRRIRRSMADVVDLIVLAIEAGLGFDQAVNQAVEKLKGPLSEELARVLDEIRVGKPQGEAFRDMAERIKMSELTLLVAAIDQATRMGTGLAAALRLQAVEIRERRMAYIKEQAGKLPVKMMMPLVFCIFPALFVVILGPAGVKIMEMAAKGMF